MTAGPKIPNEGADLARIPPAITIVRSLRVWVRLSLVAGLVLALPHFFVQYWFIQSLGLRSLFWTNIQMQALLFIAGLLTIAGAAWVPTRRLSSRTRGAAREASLWCGIGGGWWLASSYAQFLLAANGVPFAQVDPVFGLDIGFFIYRLPVWLIVLRLVEAALTLSLGLHLLCCWLEPNVSEIEAGSRFRAAIRTLRQDLHTRVLVISFGLVAAAHTLVARYQLLFRDNSESGVRTGAEYLDVTGFFSTLNTLQLSVAVELGLMAVVVWWLAGPPVQTPRTRQAVRMALVLLAIELGFFVGLRARDHIVVAPNEPHIQRAFIRRHIEATLRAYRLDEVEAIDWQLPSEPPRRSELANSATLLNAPFLSPWVAYLESPPDIQHYGRIEIADSSMVYGPMLKIFRQQQQLRPYYDFLSVDGVRYSVDGSKRMFVSAVRELPSQALVGEKEWLKYWGSAALLFTHGMGLVMSPVNETDDVGSPIYVSEDVPPRTSLRALDHEPRVYFGEGARDDYVLTGVRALKEIDYGDETGYRQFEYPAEQPDGILLNSWFRRIVFALYTRDATAFIFSDYIDPDRTRVHVLRTPIQRLTAIADFLYLDTNVYAFVAEGAVKWMINGLTESRYYPYSYREVLGDKADERAVEPVSERSVNYAEDSVKITLDAFSGEVRLYQWSEDPVISSWAAVYPDLFRPRSEMPEAVANQLTYPLQWFHLQFDDVYKRYHQTDEIQFYNSEDLWDDADETLGSTGRGLSGFGAGDELTFSYEGYDLLVDPADLPAAAALGKEGDLQYLKLKPFTPEAARNLRALIIACQEPDNYGRLLSLQLPQGVFVPGPEQIDSYIDNDRPVHQQVTMWIRHASEVIRGQTLLLPVRGGLMYVEPIWVNSLQNALPQVKLFAVWHAGEITSGQTLQEAVRGRGTETVATNY